MWTEEIGRQIALEVLRGRKAMLQIAHRFCQFHHQGWQMQAKALEFREGNRALIPDAGLAAK